MRSCDALARQHHKLDRHHATRALNDHDGLVLLDVHGRVKPLCSVSSLAAIIGASRAPRCNDVVTSEDARAARRSFPIPSQFQLINGDGLFAGSEREPEDRGD